MKRKPEPTLNERPSWCRCDIGSAVFEIWKYASAGKIDTLKTVTFRG